MLKETGLRPIALALSPDSAISLLPINLSTIEVMRAALKRVCLASSILEIFGFVWMSLSTFHSFRGDLALENAGFPERGLRIRRLLFVFSIRRPPYLSKLQRRMDTRRMQNN